MRRKMSEREERHMLDRMIIGNQIEIMRALAAANGGGPTRLSTASRINDIKNWWRENYLEEVGYNPAWGDTPPR